MKHYLRSLLAPTSVALFGATERPQALGRVIYENLLTGPYQGELFAINPKYEQLFARPCYRDLSALPQTIELAVIVTPPETVAGILQQCGKHKVSAAVIITAGFAETGMKGKSHQQELLRIAREFNIRILGPNCLGVLRPSLGFNASFANGGADAGSLGLISQSGAVVTAILDWARSVHVGFSSVVSLGGAADVDFGELLDFLLHDETTRSILLYIEGVRDARRFLSALRAAARVKPVIVLKAGRSRAGIQAATSHTGALVGSDAVFATALSRCGTVRVKTYTQLFAAARILATCKLPLGDRLVIVTNGGGPGVLAADSAVENGISLAQLSESSIEQLNQVLPAHWSHGNPVDIIGDATPERFAQAVQIALHDDGVDAGLALYAPQAVTSAKEAAQAVIAAAQSSSKPFFTAWLGELNAPDIRGLFEQAGVANFYTPENAVEAFAFLNIYRRNQQWLMEVPPSQPAVPPPELAIAHELRARAVQEGRVVLTEVEAKTLLQAFHIPVPRTAIAGTQEEAVHLAKQIGYPVALKIYSPDITHKSDVGGVALNLLNGAMLQKAYQRMMSEIPRRNPQAKLLGVTVQKMIRRPGAREVLVGVATDPVFGPVISFGAGGIAVESLRDYVVMLPPLNAKLAAELIQATGIAKLLRAYRNVPAVDSAALEYILLQVSAMVCALPWLKEMDLNPVLSDQQGAIVLDARVVIDPQRELESRHYQHMAIHPYPKHLEEHFSLSDGNQLLVRPIRPEDARIESEFVSGLSEQSRYLRFMHYLPELTPQMLARFTQIDYATEMALIVLMPEPQQMIAVARYVSNPDGESAEFAVTVADAWQKRGIGSMLLKKLLACAKAQGLQRLEGTVLAINQGMLRLVGALDFTVRASEGREELRVVKKL